MFRDRRRVSIHFQPEGVVLANGQRRERWPGVQDTASQFVQLTYLFTTRPELLKVGGTVEVPLALPRSMDRRADGGDLVLARAALPAGADPDRAGSADLSRPGDRAQAGARGALNDAGAGCRAGLYSWSNS